MEILVERVLPYFQRTNVKFSSHLQTPPQKQADAFPAVVAVRRLIGPAPFGAGLPTTVMLYPRRRGDALLLTLLHYVPIRKALDIDVIEEHHSFAGEKLRLLPDAESARVFGDQLNGQEL